MRTSVSSLIPGRLPGNHHIRRMLGAILAFGYAALFLLVITKARFFEAPGLPRRTIGGLFLLKIGAGTVLWYIYTFVYTDRATADIYRYFDDGNIMFQALPGHPLDYLRMLTGIGNDQVHFDVEYYQVMHNWYRQFESNMYNDAHTMIRFNAFVRLFSFGHFHVHTVFACFASTVGLVALYRTFSGRTPGHEGVLIAALFLLPSVLFWSSGVIKEALLLFGLGLFLLNLLGPVRHRYWPVRMLVLVFCVTLLFFLKLYVLLSLLPALIAYLWCQRTQGAQVWLRFGFVYAAFIVAGLNSEHIIPRFSILEAIWVKQRDFIGMAHQVKAGSLVEVTPLEPNAMSFLRQSPHALYMTFLSPFTTWRNGAMGLLSAMENVLVIGLPLLAILWRRPWKAIDKPLLLFATGFCLLLSLVIGWTTPVIGALVRYRVPMLPFLTIAALAVMDPARVPLSKWLRSKAPPK